VSEEVAQADDLAPGHRRTVLLPRGLREAAPCAPPGSAAGVSNLTACS
jgi:hypothetical protein